MEVKNQRIKQGRLSRMPLVLLLGLCAAILIAAFISLQSTSSELKQTDDKGAALLSDAREQIARLQAQSRLYENQEPKPQPKPEQPPLPKLSALEWAALYERMQGVEPAAKDDPKARLKAQRERAFLQALSVSSNLELNFSAGSSAAGGVTTISSTGSALTAAQQKELEESKKQLAALKARGSGNELSAYDALSEGDEHALPYTLQSVDTPYIVRQGSLVPAVLMTGINSDVPGQVIAQTSAPVYDSPLGNYELIPKGSRLIGQYVSQPAYGTERVMLAFNRIILPDGKALTLGAMPAASGDGYAGFEAEVDNHMFRLISGALLLGGITAAVSLSQDDVYDDDGNITVSSAMTQAVGASLGQVLAQVVERNINIAPTLTVKPGYEFNLTLVKDLRFDGPYQGFDYAA